ncbi:MAG: hypothetical protein CO003_00940 [Candidatus Portnoybacteria bacterium CG_4_8_14_3_um_filter_44_15]|uniref:TraC-like domain-containing protein n=4 Tax=Candidatus Portnoyibacteriota TaxID=1817913 RepID=A0A2M7YLE4_9BACT|nr:MAG: hypothetical protein COX45_01330 [Candidatus Portnoybacteria bacterium CG23_combo_of_CG06-09_8_20_14_all_44_36]PIW74766.1 MAG: hypothetical protein CO003_00940 [Candidatus Portnoybacteria bacterium CG_4_8_14_3_um_filter_44_15]PIZ69605.1 MAG: hypothetical protein COY10_01135 [Candidatus Portnoybacteria bacterium CG_4_10_14_0_2_um_filter_43_36]PJA63791.1 MAG: hypothetical protein CO160_01945 [Candidatus Portnoybacteria bacterium CG_4_9_14_3_um_filter_43_11]PJE59367.1 MAG: hypothetical pro
MGNNIKASSIQKHLEISNIKDDVIVLKNGGMRAILMTTSLNFALKSTDEQDAIIYHYQEFLNSLDFSVQILAVSRKFNIDLYIQSLKEKEDQQENELLKIQTSEYIDFIKSLTEMNNIMTDSFFVVVPYAPPVVRRIGFLNKIIRKKQRPAEIEESFQEFKNNLWQRVEFIAIGLLGMDIKAAPLNTGELIELFYKLYNPNAKEGPEIEKANELKIQ